MAKKHKKRLLPKKLIIAAVFVLWSGFLLCDLYRTRLETPPIFALPLITYEGGSAVYYGLGYKIWKDVNILTDVTEYYMTAWFVPLYTLK
jgi:hypothetical protein